MALVNSGAIGAVDVLYDGEPSPSVALRRPLDGYRVILTIVGPLSSYEDVYVVGSAQSYEQSMTQELNDYGDPTGYLYTMTGIVDDFHGYGFSDARCGQEWSPYIGISVSGTSMSAKSYPAYDTGRNPIDIKGVYGIR